MKYIINEMIDDKKVKTLEIRSQTRYPIYLLVIHFNEKRNYLWPRIFSRLNNSTIVAHRIITRIFNYSTIQYFN
jgi:hypothetical protein